ncbi:hypothetical protein D3C81_1095030 [compost metagenome]
MILLSSQSNFSVDVFHDFEKLFLAHSSAYGFCNDRFKLRTLLIHKLLIYLRHTVRMNYNALLTMNLNVAVLF